VKSKPIPAPAVGKAPVRTHYKRAALLAKLNTAIDSLRFSFYDKRRLALACEQLANALDGCSGGTLQERWTTFESSVWTKMGGWRKSAFARPLDLGSASDRHDPFGDSQLGVDQGRALDEMGRSPA
jgi:hypothetical protein